MELINQPPGTYPNIPEETYHRWRGASASRLSALMQSPAHALYGMTYRGKVTPALKRGSALHCKVLTPEAFDTRFVINQDRKTSPDDEVTLGASDYAAVLGMAEAIAEHPVAAELLADRAAAELSIVWNESEFGVRRKARLDRLSSKRHTIVDLKTTADASPREFRKSIFNYGYHRQAATYLEAAAAAGIPAEHFIIIAVETDARIVRNGRPAHAVATYVLEMESIDAGAHENSELLARWRECEEAGYWPGYLERIVDIGLPAWALKKEGDE